MDVYYAMTNYHLLDCVLHKLFFNRENDAKILLSSFLIYHDPKIVESLKETGIFNEVIVYEEVIFSHEENIVMQDEIGRICNEVKRRYGELINNCDNIYVCQDCESLGVYLVTNEKKYYFFEDASGTYSKSEILLDIIKKENRNRYEIIKQLKLGGKSKYVLGVFCDFKTQGESFDPSGCVDFSVKELLKKLDTTELAKILKVYKCHRYDLRGQKKVLLLTWHYNNMGFLTLDEQRDFFALLVDYFKNDEEKLFIKPHPSDEKPDYRNWFEDSVVLERNMPSELLPFCVDGKFEKGITNWSTSVYSLREILKNIISFDKDIDETWRDFHKYFAIVQYLNSNKKIYRQRVKLIGVNQKQIVQLAKKYIKGYERFYRISERGSIYCVDKYDKKYNGKKCIALAGENNNELCGVLRIKYKEKTDFVYLYNLNDNNIHIEKEMHYSGGRVIIDVCRADEYAENARWDRASESKGGISCRKRKK